MKYFLPVFVAIITWLASANQVKAEFILDGHYNNCPSGYSCPGSQPADCNNGPNSSDSGGCGTACGGGSPWSRYESVCKNLAPRDDPEVNCNYAWVRAADNCSTANKCVGDEQGLRAGTCDCGVGGLYRACCSGSTPVSCVHYAIQDPYPPPEGVCPANSTQVDCPSGNPAECCAAVNPTPTLAPNEPTPTPGSSCPYWCTNSPGECSGTVHSNYTCSNGGDCCETGSTFISGCDNACSRVGGDALVPGSIGTSNCFIPSTAQAVNGNLQISWGCSHAWSTNSTWPGLSIDINGDKNPDFTAGNWSTGYTINNANLNQSYQIYMWPACASWTDIQERAPSCYATANYTAPTNTPTPTHTPIPTPTPKIDTGPPQGQFGTFQCAYHVSSHAIVSDFLWWRDRACVTLAGGGSCEWGTGYLPEYEGPVSWCSNPGPNGVPQGSNLIRTTSCTAVPSTWSASLTAPGGGASAGSSGSGSSVSQSCAGYDGHTASVDEG